LFPQIGLKFLENRNNPEAFEPKPQKLDAQQNNQNSQISNSSAIENYSVKVDGKVYEVVVAPSGQIENITSSESTQSFPLKSSSAGSSLNAPLAGNVFKLIVNVGDQVAAGDVVIIMEAMKMETEIRCVNAGKVTAIHIKEGDAVSVGECLLSLS